MINLPTPHQMQAFLALSEQQTLDKAAEQLEKSRYFVWHQVANLEKVLGTALYVKGRGKRELTLTPRGVVLLPEFADIVATLTAIKEHLSGLDTVPTNQSENHLCVTCCTQLSVALSKGPQSCKQK